MGVGQRLGGAEGGEKGRGLRSAIIMYFKGLQRQVK